MERLLLSKGVILLAWDDHPQDGVDQNSWDATWNECNDQCKAEPKRTNAEEFSKSATDASHDAITSGSAQSPFLIDRHFFNSFVDISIQYTQRGWKSSRKFRHLFFSIYTKQLEGKIPSQPHK